MTEQREPQERQHESGSAERRTFGPEVMATRRAVRQTLKPFAELHRPVSAGEFAAPLVLVGLSGGADSLALALALAYEVPKCGLRAGAIIVDHGLQEGSANTAAAAAAQARQMGLDPVVVESVQVTGGTAGGGPEAAARQARYAAFVKVAEASGAQAILTAHTHDDQAEQVLLALARGSGLRSLAGIPAERALNDSTHPGESTSTSHKYLLRPFLTQTADAGGPAITRDMTEAACIDQGFSFWNDPHNLDPSYARVRVRQRVLPMLEDELGPGVADALVRTADLAREDADALDEMARVHALGLLSGRSNVTASSDAELGVQPEMLALCTDGLVIEVTDLAGLMKPVLYRVIRLLARLRFGAYLERVHTLAIAELVTSWSGQGTLYVPGIAVTRRAGMLSFERQVGSPRG